VEIILDQLPALNQLNVCVLFQTVEIEKINTEMIGRTNSKGNDEHAGVLRIEQVHRMAHIAV